MLKMVGMNKQEVIDQISELNKSKYESMYTNKRNEMINKYGEKSPDFFDNFSCWYLQEFAPQFVSEIIEENNKKISDDIQKLLSK
jgi:hypothetical protein